MYMAADSVHGSITLVMKRELLLCDLEDYIGLIKGCKRNLEVSVIDHAL